MQVHVNVTTRHPLRAELVGLVAPAHVLFRVELILLARELDLDTVALRLPGAGDHVDRDSFDLGRREVTSADRLTRRF